MTTPLDRRTFLRAAGVALALPFLESMNPAVAAPATTAPANPRRLVAVGTPFGFDPYVFVPTTAGRDYALTPHLEHLKAHRDDLTICSGLSHPNTGGGGHKAEAVMLTGAPYPDYSYNLKNTVSIDQAFAASQRGRTRYDSLVLTTYSGSLSYTGNGVNIPAIDRPSQIFAKLFLASTPQQQADELRRIGDGRSTLDFVGEQAKRLERRVSAADRHRLGEYFESVRDVERQLQMSGEWVNRPKPKAPVPAPQDLPPGEAQQREKLQLMFDMIHLALVTDATRSITIKTFGGHHDLSHHGKEPKKLAACRQVEVDLLKTLDRFLTKLKAAEGAGGRMLDSTMVLVTSNLRDGNTHWTHDLPVVLAGGGFKHGQHLVFNKPYLQALAQNDPTKHEKPPAAPSMGRDQMPLCNLFLSMLHRGGVEADRFGSSTGTLTGLDPA
ncbi:MAG TPA: DUF1552 domain-containing protein [Humisphaera sp.]